MSYNLFLDDFREPEDAFDYTHNQLYLIGWVVVRSYEEFVNHIEKNGIPVAISFDHDLADVHYRKKTDYDDENAEKTGYHCAKWFINYCIDNNYDIPETILVHSMNPVGKLNIQSLFDTYEKCKK